jgi:hypothetical protein
MASADRASQRRGEVALTQVNSCRMGGRAITAPLWPTRYGGQAAGIRPPILALLAASLCLWASACVENGEGVPFADTDPGVEPKSYAEIQATIFEPICALSCHRAGAAPKGLVLQKNYAIKHLVGVPSAEAPGLMRVAPGQPDQSYLVIKVVSFDSRRKGARMPRNGPRLGFGQVRALKRWIKAGAKADWEAKNDEEDVLRVPFDGGALDAAQAVTVDGGGAP